MRSRCLARVPLTACIALASFACKKSVDDRIAVDAPIVAVDATSPVDAPTRLNGCTRDMAVDRSAADADRTITVQDDFYTPRCMRIAPGQQVTWRGDFEEHPLEPGIIRTPDVEQQPGSPILSTGSGSTATFTFPDAGDWAYYCTAHPPTWRA